jgi:hypothetical protein
MAESEALAKRGAEAIPRFTLDKSRIPKEMWDDPRLLKAEAQIALAMQKPEFRFSISVHEAAHGVYMMRAGAKKLIYQRPMVKSYEKKTDRFDIGTAGIQPDFGPQEIKLTSIHVARWYAAPTAAMVVLTAVTAAESEAGSGSDKEDFPKYIRRAAGNQITCQAIEWHWQEAIKDVTKDLRSPAFRQEIYNLAHAFEDWLMKS